MLWRAAGGGSNAKSMAGRGTGKNGCRTEKNMLDGLWLWVLGSVVAGEEVWERAWSVRSK